MDIFTQYGIMASVGGAGFLLATGASQRYDFTFVDNTYVVGSSGAIGTLSDYAVTNPLMQIQNGSIIFSNPAVVHNIHFYASGSYLGYYTLNNVANYSSDNYLGHWNETIPANATHFRLQVHKNGFTGTYGILLTEFKTALVGYETTTTSTYSSGGKTYQVHTFAANGTFTVSKPGLVDYLIIGGGGGSSSYDGGGGGGGFREFSQVKLTNGTYSVVVGAGGARANSTLQNSGDDSSFNNHVSAGGGSGGRYRFNDAQSGGSGGGGGAAESATYPGAAGNTPSVTPSQGNNGGSGVANFNLYSGGGGGAGGAGVNAVSGKGGNGGIGKQSSITGTAVYYAGGGGGAAYSGTPGTGGLGGGGNGRTPSVAGVPGTNRLGGGSGAGGDTGGSGIVIIRYELNPSAFTTYELLYDSDVSATLPATQIDITGLNITKDDEIRMVYTVQSSVPTLTTSYSIYPNNLTAATNYYTQFLIGSGTTLTPLRQNANRFSQSKDTNTSSGFVDIKVSNNDRFVAQSNDIDRMGVDSANLRNLGLNIVGTQTVASITSLSIVASDTNGIQPNSRFRLYKVNKGAA